MEEKIGFQEWLFGPRYRFLVGGGVPPLVALLVLFQHRSNLSSVLKPTQYWRKNALKQNKKDKYRGEERTFRYNMRGEQLERERINDSVFSAA